MPKRKASGNMYEDVQWLWDPLGGECPHKCAYCYAAHNRHPAVKEKYSGEICIVEKEMNERFRTRETVFVCDMNDLFADGVPVDFQIRILDNCAFDSLATYMYQTKDPSGYLNPELNGHWPQRRILGCTIESDIFYEPFMGEAPTPIERAIAMGKVQTTKFITIEPIMRFNLAPLLGLLELADPDYIYIGADSGGCGLPEPSSCEIQNLIKGIQNMGIQNMGIQIKAKHNLERLMR